MTILVADIGGTYMRLALSDTGHSFTRDPQKIKTDNFLQAEDALLNFVHQENRKLESITQILVAKSTRNNWNVCPDNILSYFKNSKFQLMNDFSANALGVIDVRMIDLYYLGGYKPVPDITLARAVIGSGTGVGLAYIGMNQFVYGTHGGHMRPAFITQEQTELFKELQQYKKDDTIPIYEDALSGNGILNIYKILSGKNHLECEYRDTNHLLAEGRNNPLVQETLRYYHEILGIFAHQVLAFGASYGGLYLTGGIIDRLIGHDLFNKEIFFNNLYQKNVPIVLNDVYATPVFWIKDEFISLRGLLRQSLIEKT